MTQFRLIVGSDDAGLDYKNRIADDLRNDPRVVSVIDVGVVDSGSTATYGDVAIEAGRRIAAGEADRAILICGTGIGVAIGANKVPGIRAATAHDSFSVERSILSNNCQVLAMGQRVIGVGLARRLATEWLDYEFDHTSNSARKVAVIETYESNRSNGSRTSSA